jgi:hypothetical protein
MNTHHDLKARTTLYSTQFASIAKLLEPYLASDAQIQKTLRSLSSFLGKKMPDRDDYRETIIQQYLLHSGLSHPNMLSRLLDERQASLGDPTKEVLAYWVSHPAFYAFFTITKTFSDDMFEIHDLVTKEHHLLLSPALRTMQKRGESRNVTYLALLLDNGECLQTAGMLHYNHLVGDDIAYFARTVDAAQFTDGGLDAVLHSHPQALYVLDQLSNIPAIQNNQSEMRLHTAEVKTVSYTFDPAYWDTDKRGDVACYILREASSAMQQKLGSSPVWQELGMANLRVFKLRDRWMLAAFSKEAFHVLVSLMGFPSLQTQQAVNLALVFFLEKEGYRAPWFPITFVPEKPQEEPADMKSLNAFMQEFQQAYNTGKTFDVERAAAKHGIGVETARQIMESLQKTVQKRDFVVPEQEKVYERADWPVPPPSLRRSFSNDLYESGLFFIQESDAIENTFNALSGNLFVKEVEQLGIIGFMEETFEDVFEDESLAYLSLNTCLWILLHLRDTPVLVRSLALETMRLFPLLAEDFTVDSYAELLSEAVFTVFCRSGLCAIPARPKAEVRRRALYTIQPSLLLQTIFVVRPYSV